MSITIERTVHPLLADDFQILATLPKEEPKPKTRNCAPMTVHIAKNPDTPLGAYVYSIPATRDPKQPIYQTLLNNSTDELVDLTKRLGGLVSKKYSVPSYVSISGDVSLEEFVPLAKEVFATIQSVYE